MLFKLFSVNVDGFSVNAVSIPGSNAIVKIIIKNLYLFIVNPPLIESCCVKIYFRTFLLKRTDKDTSREAIPGRPLFYFK